MAIMNKDNPVKSRQKVKAILTLETDTDELLIEERRRLIVKQIEAQGRVKVEELATQFNISAVTVRLDLNALANIGAVVRTHGGAVAQNNDDDLPIIVKQYRHSVEKSRIAEQAVQLIRDGQTIVLDSGTTTCEIAKRIRGLKINSINVITNALNIVAILADVTHVTLIMPGGVLRPKSNSFAGLHAGLALQKLQADIFFMGFDGLDPDIGVMTPYLLEAQLNSEMMRISKMVVAVGDSSKIDARNLSVIAKVEQIHMLITDLEADSVVVEKLRARGVEVVTV